MCIRDSEKGGLLAGLRAEALKSRHAAPVRLAVLMALPMPCLLYTSPKPKTQARVAVAAQRAMFLCVFAVRM